MKRLLVATLVCVVGSLQAFAAISPAGTSIPIVKVDPRLRSAFLLREMGSPSEYRYSAADGLQSQLQTHFDAVLEKLATNRERSLAIAMARLERRQGVRWTAAQRDYWHRYLSEQRDLNIERLMAYRDRGLFPLNEGQDAEGAPIFVDNHDTACAVGHLMRESGWEREVELIAATNLLVYVTDVRTGPLVNWVLQSGLTLGEAALIQPLYAPPISEVPMSSLGTFTAPATYFDGTGERTVANGLSYENFLWRKMDILSPPGSPTISGLWNQEFRSDIGVRDDYQTVVGRPECDICLPEYSAGWPYANLLSVAPDADTYAIGTGLSAYAISFDVVSTRSSLGVDRVGVFLPYGFNMNAIEAWTYVTESPFGPQLETLSVTAFPAEKGGTPSINSVPLLTFLGSLYSVADLFNSQGNEQNEDSVIFEPRARIRVHTFILVRAEEFMPPSTFGAVTHEIRLAQIPEPTSAVLACCFAIGLVRRRN